jgi:hypothetical protein
MLLSFEAIDGTEPRATRARMLANRSLRRERSSILTIPDKCLRVAIGV